MAVAVVTTGLLLAGLPATGAAQAATGSCLTYPWTGGDGSAASPYLVATAADLDEVRSCLDRAFRQVADIDLAAVADWVPIGDTTTPFRGTYDGDGHAITAMTVIGQGGELGLGLFGAVVGATASTPALVRDLRLTDVTITVPGATAAVVAVGALAGQVSGAEISGVVATGTAAAGRGITIVAGSHGVRSIGGLVGEISRSLLDPAPTSLTGVAAAVDVAVSGNGVASVGGLVGAAAAQGTTVTLAAARASGALTGTLTGGAIPQDAFGGLIGRVGASSGVSTDAALLVRDSLATGAVTAPDLRSVGGLVGEALFVELSASVNIVTSYATGAVSGQPGTTGGLVGVFMLSNVQPTPGVSEVLDSYWDTQATGQTASAGGTPATSAQLRTRATFAGWDIGGFGSPSPWGMCSPDGTGPPFLWAFEATDPCAAPPVTPAEPQTPPTTSPTAPEPLAVAPTPVAQVPVRSLNLPKRLARAGWTRVTRVPVRTNAGQVATVRVACRTRSAARAASAGPTASPRLCRTATRRGTLRVWLPGTRATVVRVVVAAPAVTGFTAMRIVRVYRTGDQR